MTRYKPIVFHSSFNKSYTKRIKPNNTLKKRFTERVLLFANGKRDEPLNDHPLKGSKYGKRSFSITGDVRVIYEETENEIIFLDVGTHNQVY